MYSLLVTGDVPGASTYFNPLLQQSIVPCTSGTRPSSPPDGMAIWETDTERYMSWNASAAAWVYLGQMLTGTYTPAVTASTTNPTLGTSNVASARYTLRNGNWCDVRGVVKFGTSGVSAGSGAYSITLPFTSNANISAGNIGTGGVYLFDSSGPAAASGTVFLVNSASTFSMLANTNQVAGVQPWTWAANDYMSFTFTYETV
jgi:hypothetical protein